MKYILALAAVLAGVTYANQPAPDGTFIGLSLNSFTSTYLKSWYLPALFNIVSDIEVPEQDFKEGWFKFKAYNIEAKFPEPSQQFINEFDSHLNGGNNSVVLSTDKQELTLDMDMKVYVGKLRISKFHLNAKIKDLGFFLETALNTQEAANAELAPYINLKSFTLDMDKSHSKIKLTGGIIPRLIDIVLDLFDKSIFKKVIKAIESAVADSVVPSINQLLNEHGTQFTYQGFTFDFAQIQAPVITDDQISVYLNGTFFADAAPEQAVRLAPNSFELVEDPSMRDFSLSVSQESFLSLLDTLVAGPALNVSQIFSEVMGKDIAYSSICWLSRATCDYHYNLPVHPEDMPLNVYIKPSKIDAGKIVDNNFTVGADVNVRLEDLNDNVLVDYTLVNFTTTITLKSHPKIDQIYGHVDNFNFTTAVVNDPGLVHVDPRQITQDWSDTVRDTIDLLNDEALVEFPDDHRNSFNPLGPFFLKEMGFQLTNGTLAWGFDLDPIFLGRPQVWH